MENPKADLLRRHLRAALQEIRKPNPDHEEVDRLIIHARNLAEDLQDSRKTEDKP